ncbi:PaaX family transcriptional regulator C-terminal domain-containing protein [Streptomyces sp. NPDC059810]|uniref:PaaX family transcriptional regulator C-terminal domain-containing protein n=1 Tax=Streptomyces sp. NPDC059810 TaxID=3346956 RepID=UPI00365CB5B9
MKRRVTPPEAARTEAPGTSTRPEPAAPAAPPASAQTVAPAASPASTEAVVSSEAVVSPEAVAPAEPAAPADDSAWNPVPTRTLVHALVRTDGTVDAGELYTVAGLLSMTDQQVRLCVKRLVAEGRFTHEGRGRKAVLRAVADPTGAIAPDAAHVGHAYRQDHGLAPWDGRWHLFAFAVPESCRARRGRGGGGRGPRRGAPGRRGGWRRGRARGRGGRAGGRRPGRWRVPRGPPRPALRDTLLHLGAAPLHGGLYAAAHPIAPLVEAQARHLGVPGQVTYLTSTDLRIGDVTEPRELAAVLWPLDEIAARHDRLAGFARGCLDRLGTPDDAERAGSPTAPERLTLAVQLAAAFTNAMRPDPLLPPELLPEPWPGAGARRLFATAWTALTTGPAPDSGPPLPRLFALYEDLTAYA